MTRATHSVDDARRAQDPERDLAAIILTGGHSTRMGRPKAWLDLGGKPLLIQVARQVRPLVREIVVVAAQGQALPALDDVVLDDPTSSHAPTPCPVTVVSDRVPDLGPLPALALGLETVRAAYAFALACDAALVRRPVLELLARERTRARAVIPVWEDRAQPLVAIYARQLAPELARIVAAGERSLQVILGLADVHRIVEEEIRSCDADGLSFRALNTPDDYAAARTTWASRRAP